MEKDHLERLRGAGCHVAQFNTPAWYSLEEVNYRTHRKILVVDGETAFTGGAGVADHWLGDAAGHGALARHAGAHRGPVVRILEAAFYENFIEARRRRSTPELDCRRRRPATPAGERARRPQLAHAAAATT